MIEEAITETLRGNLALMTLLGVGRNGAVDLVDVAQDTRPPYLTFNMGDGARVGLGNLCDPAALGLLTQQILVMPWAPTATEVKAINDAARAALLAGLKAADPTIQTIQWTGYRPWAREPGTNLLTRGQVFTVQHTE